MIAYFVIIVLMMVLGWLIWARNRDTPSIESESQSTPSSPPKISPPKIPRPFYPSLKEMNSGNKYIQSSILAMIKTQNPLRIVSSIRYYQYGSKFYYLVNFLASGNDVSADAVNSDIDNYCQLFKTNGELVGGFQSSTIYHDDFPDWSDRAVFIDWAYVDPFIHNDMYNKWIGRVIPNVVI